MPAEDMPARTWVMTSHGNLSVLPAIVGVLLVLGSVVARTAGLEPRVLSKWAFGLGAIALLWSGRSRQVDLRLVDGELVLGPSRRIRLDESELSFGRYRYPSVGTLGTILWLRSGRRRVRIAGMGVSLSEDEYSSPDSDRVDYTMTGDSFQELRRALAKRMPGTVKEG